MYARLPIDAVTEQLVMFQAMGVSIHSSS